jgi:hypothetical protein
MKENTCSSGEHNYKRSESGISDGKYDTGAIHYRTCKECDKRQVLKSTGWKDFTN